MATSAGALAGDVPSLARWGHELLDGHIVKSPSLRAMTRFHPGGFAEAYGLGLARSSIDDHTMWGHTGNGIASHTEFWHLPRENVTIAITWNNDNRDADILPALMRAVLGSRT